MMRNITITTDQSQQSPEYIHIANIESIVNYSCDNISVECLEYLFEQDHRIVVSNLLNKLRDKGRLIIKTSNAQNIAQKFIQKNISNSEFLNFFVNKKSIISIETIYTLIDFDTFDLLDTNITEHTIKVVLERKKYE